MLSQSLKSPLCNIKYKTSYFLQSVVTKELKMCCLKLHYAIVAGVSLEDLENYERQVHWVTVPEHKALTCSLILKCF